MSLTKKLALVEANKYGLSNSVIEILRNKGYEELTYAQEAALKAGLCMGKSLVISAPTSSGKTTIAEMAAVEGALKGKRTLYLVTHRALAEEKYLSFKSDYCKTDDPWFQVSIATGDHIEGEWKNGILVSTYEKYLALLSSSDHYAIDSTKIVIADEIQILSDKARGHDIEILCTIIKLGKPAQFVALSATAPNAAELASWFECEPVVVPYRDVPLQEGIWFKGNSFTKFYGNEEDFENNTSGLYPSTTLEAVQYLLQNDLHPVLVFTMTKKRAIELAEELALNRKQDVNSYGLSDQIELFSEPTALAKKLRAISERKITFHSADLTFSERNVIENALRERKFDVVFSSPTLASGVNFPIRTVVFDSFYRFWESSWISKEDYLNMSGRAGRLGLHPQGSSVLLPQNNVEFAKAKEYVASGQPGITSVLIRKSIRKTVLHLIASGVCDSVKELTEFIEQTFWWLQAVESNSIELPEFQNKIARAVTWLLESHLIEEIDSQLKPTRLGVAIASTGLIPSTGTWLLQLVLANLELLSSEEYHLPVLHAVCASPEFHHENGQRVLPFGRRNQPEVVAWRTVGKSRHVIPVNYGDKVDQIINAAFGMFLWCNGENEGELKNKLPSISYGQFHSLASDVSWILNGVATILRVPDLAIDQNVATKIELLAERVNFGVPTEVLDLILAAKAGEVPGFGRQRAMDLYQRDLSDTNKLLHADPKVITSILEGKQRASELLDAVANYNPNMLAGWRNKHMRRAELLGKEFIPFVSNAYDKVGIEYESAIEILLKQFAWTIQVLDRSKRQGVPDLLLKLNDKSILIECKTKESNSATISKEEAFAILTKGIDINSDHKVTIGKPDFASFAKEKATSSTVVTLVSHSVLIDAMLQIAEGKIDVESVFRWLLVPGVASLDGLHVKDR